MAELVGQDQNRNIDQLLEDPNEVDNDEWENVKGPRVRNKKKRTLQDSSALEHCGVCYLSRVPPHMGPSNIRQILSKYGDIERIYLSPEDPTAQVRRKQAGGFRGKQFSEGWVEFTKKSVAKKVANMLNGEQIGGKRRSSFYYDILNIKYLSKFKWDDLTSEIANRNHTREEKLAMEISAAKRQRDFYMTKVDQSCSEVYERTLKQEAEDLRRGCAWCRGAEDHSPISSEQACGRRCCSKQTNPLGRSFVRGLPSIFLIFVDSFFGWIQDRRRRV